MNNLSIVPSLLVFAEIAHRGSFTEAARQLSLSKSAVSQHLTRLETQLETQLITRHTRGLTLTAAGKSLLNRTALLKDQVNLTLQELNGDEVEPTGTFSITFPYLLEKNVIAPAVSQLSKEFTKLSFRLLMTDERLDIIEHDLDVSIFSGDLVDSSYRMLPIGNSVEHIYASRNYVMNNAEDLSTAESLTDLNWLFVPWQKKATVLTNPVTGESYDIKLNQHICCSSLSSALELAKSDCGIVLLPDIATSPTLTNNELVRIASDLQGKNWPFYFIHPYQKEKPQYVTRFYQLVKHYFAVAKFSKSELLGLFTHPN